jgi:hypothetical protein
MDENEIDPWDLYQPIWCPVCKLGELIEHRCWRRQGQFSHPIIVTEEENAREDDLALLFWFCTACDYIIDEEEWTYTSDDIWRHEE